jgi:hypothetical protein
MSARSTRSVTSKASSSSSSATMAAVASHTLSHPYLTPGRASTISTWHDCRNPICRQGRRRSLDRLQSKPIGSSNSLFSRKQDQNQHQHRIEAKTVWMGFKLKNYPTSEDCQHIMAFLPRPDKPDTNFFLYLVSTIDPQVPWTS